jgi:hypothetical protein
MSGLWDSGILGSENRGKDTGKKAHKKAPVATVKSTVAVPGLFSMKASNYAG